MSSFSLSATPSFTTTLSATAPTQTSSPSTQGSIHLYRSPNCTIPLSNTPTALVLGECHNAPFSDIGSVSIASLPACSDGSTPLLIVSAQAECKNATVGTEAESEEVGTCLGLEGEKDIGSMGFVCYGDGTAGEKASKAGTSAAATGSTGAAVVAPAEKDTDDSDNNNTGSNDSIDCCCCCVVM